MGEVFSHLPSSFDVPIAVVQHRMATSADALAKALAKRGPLPVIDADDKQPIESGNIYLAPPDYHLLVEPGSFALSTDALVQYARPSIDVLFESAADTYAERLIGVILTGANDDGAAGLARVKDQGGVAVVQDPSTAMRREMPDAALAAVRPDKVLPLEEIGPFIVELAAMGHETSGRT